MKTQIISHQQGSNEWHLHRSAHFNASDIAAVMGLSSYKTRSHILKEKATGLVSDVDANTQKRFDKGHEFEASARPWAEEIIGSDLYPLVLAAEVEGLPLSASLDGLTMEQDVSFEHKTGRADLLASLEAAVIPDEYHPQLEQGLLLSGAKKCLFMASSGDKKSMRFAWYLPDLELREKIIAAWKQFAIDLAAYTPVEAAPVAVATPTLGLPAVSIQVNGSIALIDNLDVFGAALTAYIAGMNLKPETDQHFADLEGAVKTFKKAEDALEAAENGALAQTASIDTMRRTVAQYKDLARVNRLLADKLVKTEKENRRIAIVIKARAAFDAHITGLNTSLGKPYMPAITADFAGVVKGLKTITSIQNAVDTELARVKIEANSAADKIRINLGTLRELAASHAFLFADTAQIVLKAPDDFTALVKTRIAEHQAAELAKEEATRERIRVEEQAKAEAAVREAERVKSEEVERLAREIEAKAKANATLAATAATAAALTDARLTGMGITKMTAVLGDADSAPVMLVEHVPAANVVSMARRAPVAPSTPPTLKLGEIGQRLGFSLTGDFLKSLGFEPAARDKSALLFHEADFENICDSLTYHINDVKQKINREPHEKDSHTAKAEGVISF